MIIIVLLAVSESLLTVDAAGDGARDWSYLTSSSFLPSEWQKAKDSSACNGKRQSPINIDTNKAEFKNNSKTVTMTTILSKGKLKNVGTSAKFDIDGAAPTFKFGPSGKLIQVAQVHWHWGSDNNKGSEHSINSKFYPIEGHIVSFDKSRFNSLGDAIKGSNSLYVLGILYEVGAENAPLKQITSQLKNIKNPKANVPMKSVNVSQFLPSIKSRYYRYYGSLTTPPCLENVMWTVMADTVKISNAQLEEFRKLQYGAPDPSGTKLVNNFRPIMPMHGRKVYSSFNASSRMIINPYFMFTLVLVALSYIY